MTSAASRSRLDQPLRFWAGQYVDLTIPGAGITRSFSMANHAAAADTTWSFIIKRYPEGAFSARSMAGCSPGDRLTAKGPYGTCFRREERPGPLLLIGGGSGMSRRCGRSCTTMWRAARQRPCASSMAPGRGGTCSILKRSRR